MVALDKERLAATNKHCLTFIPRGSPIISVSTIQTNRSIPEQYIEKRKT